MEGSREAKGEGSGDGEGRDRWRAVERSGVVTSRYDNGRIATERIMTSAEVVVRITAVERDKGTEVNVGSQRLRCHVMRKKWRRMREVVVGMDSADFEL